LLFLVAVADMEACLDVFGKAVFYADDSCIWACCDSVAEVMTELGEKAELFTRFVEGNGLVLNAAKSQLLISPSSRAVKPQAAAKTPPALAPASSSTRAVKPQAAAKTPPASAPASSSSRAVKPQAAAKTPPASAPAASPARWVASPLALGASAPRPTSSSTMRESTSQAAAAPTPSGASCVTVNGCKVYPAKTLNLLGVTFDRMLSVTPHSESVAAAAKQRAAIVARLSHHIPRGEYLRQLAQGLFVGKLGHALPAVVTARLQDSGGSTHLKATQVSMNNVCRTLAGTRKREHKSVENILASARFKSINEMAVESTAMEAWKAYMSVDGGSGERNPVGVLVFGPRLGPGVPVCAPARSMRSTAVGIIPIELRGQDTFVVRAAEMWNSSPSLRAASSIGEARKAARSLARAAPL
jgi:hypothetical protein